MWYLSFPLFLKTLSHLQSIFWGWYPWWLFLAVFCLLWSFQVLAAVLLWMDWELEIQPGLHICVNITHWYHPLLGFPHPAHLLQWIFHIRLFQTKTTLITFLMTAPNTLGFSSDRKKGRFLPYSVTFFLRCWSSAISHAQANAHTVSLIPKNPVVLCLLMPCTCLSLFLVSPNKTCWVGDSLKSGLSKEPGAYES